MMFNGYAIQFVWIKGLLLGILYYDPYMEVTNGNLPIEDYDHDEFYQTFDFCFIFFAIKITIW